MKILLIQPNPRYCCASLACSNIPLGPLYLGAALRRAGYDQVRFLDARMLRLTYKEIEKRIAAFSPDVVGITGLSPEARGVHHIAAGAKASAPACKVVVGGPYATSSPEAALSDPMVDFAVVGEGERTICALIGALSAGTPLEDVDGLAFRKDGVRVMNRPRAPIEDLDVLPLPAWDLAEVEKYFHLWSRHSQNPFLSSGRSMPLMTSRGCPYNCIYCHNIFGKKTRLRGAESVLDEMETLVGKYGAKEIEILDDIFNIDLPRAKSICDGIVRRGLKVRLSFPNGLRVDRMDEELVVKLKQAGTNLVAYAIETASPRLQREIKKNLDLEKAARIIRFTAEQGINICGFFMLGFPGETRKEMLATIDFAVKEPFNHANFFYVTPKPGTPLFEAVKGKAMAAASGDYYSYSINLSAVPDWLFTRMCSWAYTRFYKLRPIHLLIEIVRIPDKLYMLKLLVRAFFLRGLA